MYVFLAIASSSKKTDFDLNPEVGGENWFIIGTGVQLENFMPTYSCIVVLVK